MRKTKIVATIGPASEPVEQLERLIDAGLDVARLNFSHGSHDEHRRMFADLRSVSARMGCPVAILQDLAGPKIRIGDFADGKIRLTPGDEFRLTSVDLLGDESRVSVNYQPLPDEVRAGDRLLLADGALELEVVGSEDNEVVTRVITGGRLGSRKGINLPSSSLSVPSLTKKDLRDLALGVELGVDFVALSFVRRPEDLERTREEMRRLGQEIPLIAKVEKHEAIANMDEIIASADGVMVARGDLGVETPLERVPAVQKQLIAKCNRAGKPVITATQMLGSMVSSPRPTRAEATDVANAILDGTDAVMLSEESAVGEHSVEAVRTMDRIARATEHVFPYETWSERVLHSTMHGVPEAVARAACDLAESLDAGAVIPFTRSGSTSLLVAKYRPRMPILAPCSVESTLRRLRLSWGVFPLPCERVEDTEVMVKHACEVALASGLVERGESVVLTAGLPVGRTGITNTIRAAVLE